ncbi:MAG: glycosyltransferase family 2 protein [Tateyamaria sp.]|uniref:glycosyltransferase family 2 protein n=1 Tax=Tateyamaria sp. TaxID=1929288 RepID=UPI00329C781C
MQVILHTGTAVYQFAMLQKLMAQKREKLLEQGILLPLSAGKQDHFAPFLAGTAQLNWHPYRAARGYSDPDTLKAASAKWIADIGTEIATHRPRALLFSMADMWSWCDSKQALQTFLQIISVFSDDIYAVLHLARPEDALCQRFIWQVSMGRHAGLSLEEAIADSADGWWSAAHHQARRWLQSTGDARVCLHNASPALDQAAMLKFWREALQPSCITLRPLPARFTRNSLLTEFRTSFDLKARIGKIEENFSFAIRPHPGRNQLRRWMRINLEMANIETGMGLGHVPLRIRRQTLAKVQTTEKDLPVVEGDFAPLVRGINTGSLFAPLENCETLASLEADDEYDTAPVLTGIEESVRIFYERRAAETKRQQQQEKAAELEKVDLSTDGSRLLNESGRKMLAGFRDSRFAPRNTGVVSFDESLGLPSLPLEPSASASATGTLVVACMKDEAPYILEWVAYHKSIGVDHFLVFTNDCSDGTDALLNRLSELGHVTHERNDEWKGNSPQQAALNRAMKMKVLQEATWLIHIDVDEFINIRFGNGTLAEVYAADLDVTNFAMTWRVFGNAGIEELGDASVIDRFIKCAPSYAPKPHTMWGFKSITKNAGIYSKLGCHRPNKPVDTPPVTPKWLNGSLRDMTPEGTKPGTWRNSVRSVGYDMVQLNHYALRSRDSFIVKRKRGRALHTDRSIGLNYWVRHDWNTHTDRTILRHLARMQHQKAELLADPILAELHERGLVWHRARVAELAKITDFQHLRNETKHANLTDLERVTYSVIADMES